jgi:hypothetical protein
MGGRLSPLQNSIVTNAGGVMIGDVNLLASIGSIAIGGQEISRRVVESYCGIDVAVVDIEHGGKFVSGVSVPSDVCTRLAPANAGRVQVGGHGSWGQCEAVQVGNGGGVGQIERSDVDRQGHDMTLQDMMFIDDDRNSVLALTGFKPVGSSVEGWTADYVKTIHLPEGAVVVKARTRLCAGVYDAAVQAMVFTSVDDSGGRGVLKTSVTELNAVNSMAGLKSLDEIEVQRGEVGLHPMTVNECSARVPKGDMFVGVMHAELSGTMPREGRNTSLTDTKKAGIRMRMTCRQLQWSAFAARSGGSR